MLLSIFEAVKRLPIGDCTAIFFSTPAVTLLMSTVLLKEHCGVYRLLIGTCLVIGVVIISRPPALFPAPPSAADNTTASNVTHSESEDSGLTDTIEVKQPYDLVGLAFAVAMPFLSAWVAIITRELRTVHFSILVFWFAIGGLIVSVVGILFLDSEPLFFEWTWVTWLLSIQQVGKLIQIEINTNSLPGCSRDSGKRPDDEGRVLDDPRQDYGHPQLSGHHLLHHPGAYCLLSLHIMNIFLSSKG